MKEEIQHSWTKYTVWCFWIFKNSRMSIICPIRSLDFVIKSRFHPVPNTMSSRCESVLTGPWRAKRKSSSGIDVEPIQNDLTDFQVCYPALYFVIGRSLPAYAKRSCSKCYLLDMTGSRIECSCIPGGLFVLEIMFLILM